MKKITLFYKLITYILKFINRLNYPSVACMHVLAKRVTDDISFSNIFLLFLIFSTQTWFFVKVHLYSPIFEYTLLFLYVHTKRYQEDFWLAVARKQSVCRLMFI